MTILAIAAESLETAPWLRRCAAVTRLDWPAVAHAYRANWNSHTLYAVANGAGPRLASRALREALKQIGNGAVDAVMSIGICGALDPALPLREVCTATAVSDNVQTWPAQALEKARRARLLSTDHFYATAAEKRAAFDSGFGIVDMEAAAPAAWAAEKQIPFFAAKVVSDHAGEDFALDFNLYRDADGRFDRRRIALAAARNPFRYAPDLIRMAMRGKAASEILGEFLANYRF